MARKISGERALSLAGDFVNITVDEFLILAIFRPSLLLSNIKTLAGSVLSQGEKRSGTASKIKKKRGNMAKATKAKATKAKAPVAAPKKAAPKAKAKKK